MPQGKKIDQKEIERMLSLREQGLSNAQIAIEMGLSKQTVFAKIGRQKSGSRTPYGSIVTHADGESFLPGMSNEKLSEYLNGGFRAPSLLAKAEEMNIPVKPIVKKKLLTKTVVKETLQGEVFDYDIEQSGSKCIVSFRQCAITNAEFCLDSACIGLFIDELTELRDYISQKEQPA